MTYHPLSIITGLFEPSHMRYDAERVNDTGGEPSLSDMVEKAIRMLRKNNNGYFLFVEGKGLGLDGAGGMSNRGEFVI